MAKTHETFKIVVEQKISGHKTTLTVQGPLGMTYKEAADALRDHLDGIKSPITVIEPKKKS